MDMDLHILVEYAPLFLRAALTTLALAAVSMAIGLVLGLALALFRLSGRRSLSWPAYVFIEFFRTTPPLIQIVWAYFVIPVLTGVEITSFQAASLALGLNTAAFIAEIFRSAILGVDPAQRDATTVLGLSRYAAYRYVILPQAVRLALPPATTNLMFLVKSTSLAAAIGTLELMRVGQLVTTETFRPFEVLTLVSLIYFVLTYPIAALARRLETRLAASRA